MIYSKPHNIWSLHLATLPGNARCLDVGCGTGWWCNKLGSENPGYDITGIDISGDQPTGVQQEPNVRWVPQVDFRSGDWLVQPESFNLVHVALLCGCIPNYPDFYRNVFKCVRFIVCSKIWHETDVKARYVAPGGHAEFFEIGK